MEQSNNHSVGVFSFARVQSERCSQKMIRPFGDTTLTDIVLKKLREIGPDTFFAGYEKVFADKCQEAGVSFVRRSEHSVHIDGPITEILSFLKDLPYDYFLIINACLPFLPVRTIKDFLQYCQQDFRPVFAVIKRHNFYFDHKQQPLNFNLSLKTINTKTVTPVFEFAHALYFFKKDYFFETGRYWDWQEVRLFELQSKLELFDIDTEEDFLIAEGMRRTYESRILGS